MRFEGVVYRAHSPRWSFDPLSGDGAALKGGRFNRVGQKALYLSLEIETTIAEVQQGLPMTPPLVVCSYKAECEDIENLADPARRSKLDITLGDLTCDWASSLTNGLEPPSHEISSRMVRAGVAGILIPSVIRPGGTNLILWRFGPAPPQKLTVFDPDGDLPHDQSSWR